MARCAQFQKTVTGHHWHVPEGEKVGFRIQQWRKNVGVNGMKWEKMKANQSLQRLPFSLILVAEIIYYSNSKGPWDYLAQPLHFTDEDTENQKQRYGYLVVELGPESGPQLPISCLSHYILKQWCRRWQDAISTQTQPSHLLSTFTSHLV